MSGLTEMQKRQIKKWEENERVAREIEEGGLISDVGRRVLLEITSHNDYDLTDERDRENAMQLLESITQVIHHYSGPYI